MSQVWIIKFVDERGRSLLSGPVGTGLRDVRMVSSVDGDVELKADEILNQWLKANPGRTGSWSISAWVQEPRLDSRPALPVAVHRVKQLAQLPHLCADLRCGVFSRETQGMP